MGMLWQGVYICEDVLLYHFDETVVRHSIIGKLLSDAVSYRDLDTTTTELLGR